MAEKNMLLPLLLLGGVGVGFYLYNKDDTPVGLTVTKVILPEQLIGKNADGKQLSAKVVEGTWRADEDTVPITATSSDKPLLVIYEDSEPIMADLMNAGYDGINADPALITECQTTQPTDAEELTEWNTACDEATVLFEKQIKGQWREIAEGAGATEESIDEQFPIEEDVVEPETENSAAESWLGIKNPQMFINTLQSHNAF